MTYFYEGIFKLGIEILMGLLFLRLIITFLFRHKNITRP